MIFHSSPTLSSKELNVITKVLQSGHLEDGNVVCDFEEKVSNYIEKKICCCNFKWVFSNSSFLNSFGNKKGR